MAADNKDQFKKKITIIILLLAFLGAGLYYFSINLDDSDFIKPISNDEMEVLTDNEDDSEEENIDSTSSNNSDPTSQGNQGSEEGQEENDQENSQESDQNGTLNPGNGAHNETDDEDNIVSKIINRIRRTTNTPNNKPDNNEDTASDTEKNEVIEANEEKPTGLEILTDAIVNLFSDEPDSTKVTSDNKTDNLNETINIVKDLDDINLDYLLNTSDGLTLEDKNVLLIGLDDKSENNTNSESTEADFLALALFNAEDIEVEMIFIPSRLEVNEKALRTYSGDELISTLESLTGYKINYKVEGKYSAFEYYIDELDGITLTLNDPFNVPELDLKLKAGENHLNGMEALNYSRYYNPDRGELERLNRQEKILNSLYDEVIKLENLLALPHYYNQIVLEENKVNTDIDQTFIRTVIRYLRHNEHLDLKFALFNK
ncbi:MAG: LCP family protein [Bacillota bacterium]